MFTLAHISDVHLAPLPRPWPHQLLGQRIFGFINWHLLARKRYHQRSALDDLIAHMKTQTYDHLAITGDIVNIALPQEFAQSRPWLESVGTGENVSYVPGNHDAYVKSPPGEGMEIWRDYMVSNAAGTAYAESPDTDLHRGFPYVRLLDDVALVGLSSGNTTRPMLATGTLGDAQRAALERILSRLSSLKVCIVVLIHHPPLPGLAVPMRDLTDAEELAAIFAKHQIHLVLHGHNHRNERAWGQGPNAAFPVIGVPSASMAEAQHRPLARYNLYDIAREMDGWRITMRGFAARETGGAVEMVEERELQPETME